MPSKLSIFTLISYLRDFSQSSPKKQLVGGNTEENCLREKQFLPKFPRPSQLLRQ